MTHSVGSNDIGFEDVASTLRHKSYSFSVRGKRVLLIVDLANLYYCVGRNFNRRKVNYAKFLKIASENASHCRAVAYGCEDNGNSESFKSALQFIGFEVKYKELKKIQTADRIIKKGNWDVGIATDIASWIDEFDVLILASGDGDFASILNYVKSKGKMCHVIGSNISYELKDVANSYREITEDLLE